MDSDRLPLAPGEILGTASRERDRDDPRKSSRTDLAEREWRKEIWLPASDRTTEGADALHGAAPREAPVRVLRPRHLHRAARENAQCRVHLGTLDLPPLRESQLHGHAPTAARP